MAEQLSNLKADTIDGVIESLDRIIAWSKKYNKRTGYFAALYRQVTSKVRDGIRDGYFDNGPRMERLDVIFANRYIEVFEQYHHQQPTTMAWKITFDYGDKWSPIVLQHLMVGMNAHINLDLGIAAAKTVAADELPNLKGDFDKINEVLGNLINKVQDELAQIWPMFKWIDRAAGNVDEHVARIGMDLARNRAWQFALDYAAASDRCVAEKIKDAEVSILAEIFIHPSLLMRLLLLVIRLGETGHVAKKIEILE